MFFVQTRSQGLSSSLLGRRETLGTNLSWTSDHVILFVHDDTWTFNKPDNSLKTLKHIIYQTFPLWIASSYSKSCQKRAKYPAERLSILKHVAFSAEENWDNGKSWCQQTAARNLSLSDLSYLHLPSSTTQRNVFDYPGLKSENYVLCL